MAEGNAGRSRGSRCTWNYEETAFLISVWSEEEMLRQLETPRNKFAYVKIVDRLAEEGIIRTFDQVKTKIRDLKHDFKKTWQHNHKSGNGRLDPPHYQALKEFLGCREALEPSSLFESTEITESHEDGGNGDLSPGPSQTESPQPDVSLNSSTDLDTSTVNASNESSNSNQLDMSTTNASNESSNSDQLDTSTTSASSSGQLDTSTSASSSGQLDTSTSASSSGQTGGKRKAQEDGDNNPKSARQEDKNGKKGFSKKERKRKTRLETSFSELEKTIHNVHKDQDTKLMEAENKRAEDWKAHDLRVMKMQQDHEKETMSNMMGQFVAMMGQFMTAFAPGQQGNSSASNQNPPTAAFQGPPTSDFQRPSAANFQHPQSSASGFQRSHSPAPGFQHPQSSASGFQRPHSPAPGFQHPQSSASGFQRPPSPAPGFQHPQSSASGFQRPHSPAPGFQHPQSSASGFQRPHSPAPGFQHPQSSASGFQRPPSPAPGFQPPRVSNLERTASPSEENASELIYFHL
ncbi:uncharacterized protein LOC144864872 [Branchiostoma floridae x Branchiostoma japonicum]